VPVPQLELPEGYGMTGASGMFLPEEWKKK
jgi:hypothetical protein